MIASIKRIYAIFLRQIYLLRRSPPRIISFAFWPTLHMLIWGFLNKYLYLNADAKLFIFSTILGATLIATLFERSNIQIMMTFLEDIWARNIGNVLISPIRPVEMVTGYIFNGVFNVCWGSGLACSIAFLVFGYSILDIGWPLIAFSASLIISGWCVGVLLISLILRFGASGEYFGWMAAFVLSPVVAIYYPVSVLPNWLQHISWALPPTYVFEGLRELIKTGVFNKTYFITGMSLNGFYLGLSLITFLIQLKKARQRGGLFSMSE